MTLCNALAKASEQRMGTNITVVSSHALGRMLSCAGDRCVFLANAPRAWTPTLTPGASLSVARQSRQSRFSMARFDSKKALRPSPPSPDLPV